MKTFTYNISKQTDVVIVPTKIDITPIHRGEGGRYFIIRLTQELSNGFRMQEKTELIPDSMNIDECFEGGYDLDAEEPVIDLGKLQAILDNFGITLV